MAKRHLGSVRRLPSGRYQASYWHEGLRQIAEQTFVTKGDAFAHLSSIETDLRRGTWLDPSAGKVTLGACGTRWLESRTDLRPVTREKYRHMLEHHVLPVLGEVELARLSPSMVRSWYLVLRERFVTTGDDAYRMLRAILNTAVTDGLIAKNPCQVRGAGRTRSAERPVASVAEVAAAVETVPERYRLAILLPAWCQLRRGEVSGCSGVTWTSSTARSGSTERSCARWTDRRSSARRRRALAPGSSPCRRTCCRTCGLISSASSRPGRTPGSSRASPVGRWSRSPSTGSGSGRAGRSAGAICTTTTSATADCPGRPPQVPRWPS